MIGRSGERGSGISVLVAQHNDDDEEHVAISSSRLSYCQFFQNPHNNMPLLLGPLLFISQIEKFKNYQYWMRIHETI